MSECSSFSMDADQPREKLDLSVSGLMVLLNASGNEGCVCWWLGVCIYCGGLHTLMHIYVHKSIS